MKRVAFLAILLLCSTVSASANDVILKGIDTFTTTTDGSTQYSFATDPIPAGFFCKGSAPYAGTVRLKGLPLVTADKGQLEGADTIVERLDDAAFDRNGVAVTRIRMAALSLVSIEPIQTSCGAFQAFLTLNGEQRTTTMHIYREHERGGSFVAPLAVDGRMRFVPVDGRAARPLEVTGSFNFGSAREPWAVPGGWSMKQLDSVVVDSDGDGIPDRRLPGTSNFAASRQSASQLGIERPEPTRAYCAFPTTMCHEDPTTGKWHCRTCCGCIEP